MALRRAADSRVPAAKTLVIKLVEDSPQDAERPLHTEAIT